MKIAIVMSTMMSKRVDDEGIATGLGLHVVIVFVQKIECHSH